MSGSLGCFFYWDKDSRQRLKVFNKVQNTISAGAFNRNGSIYAYACSYDWSKVTCSHPPLASPVFGLTLLSLFLFSPSLPLRVTSTTTRRR